MFLHVINSIAESIAQGSAAAGADVGYVTAEGLNIRNARIQLGGVLAIGNYKWKPLSSGAIALIYDPN